jgi:hypothetical protein
MRRSFALAGTLAFGFAAADEMGWQAANAARCRNLSCACTEGREPALRSGSDERGKRAMSRAGEGADPPPSASSFPIYRFLAERR